MEDLRYIINKHSFALLSARKLIFAVTLTIYVVLDVLLGGLIISMILLLFFPNLVVKGSGLLWSLVGGLGFIFLTAAFDFLFQAKSMDRILGIYNEDPEDPEGTRLINNLQSLVAVWKVEGMIRYGARVYGSKNPELYFNAVTYTGIDYPRIVISHSLLHKLNPEELAAVVGHELGHIQYLDSYFKTVLFHISRFLEKLLWPFALILNIVRFITAFIRNIFKGSFGILLSLLIYLIFLPLLIPGLLFWIPQAIFNFFCHFQEYLADDFSAHLVQDSMLLINALMCIEEAAMGQIAESKRRFFGTGSVSKYKRYFTILYDREFRKAEFLLGDIWYFIQSLSATHPPSINRWERLAKIGFLIDEDKAQTYQLG